MNEKKKAICSISLRAMNRPLSIGGGTDIPASSPRPVNANFRISVDLASELILLYAAGARMLPHHEIVANGNML